MRIAVHHLGLLGSPIEYIFQNRYYLFRNKLHIEQELESSDFDAFNVFSTRNLQNV